MTFWVHQTLAVITGVAAKRERLVQHLLEKDKKDIRGDWIVMAMGSHVNRI
jgi:hypothetical protein